MLPSVSSALHLLFFATFFFATLGAYHAFTFFFGDFFFSDFLWAAGPLAPRGARVPSPENTSGSFCAAGIPVLPGLRRTSLDDGFSPWSYQSSRWSSRRCPREG